MLLTGVTPGDIVRFFRRIGGNRAQRKAERDYYYEDEEPAYEPQQMAMPQAAQSAPGGRGKKRGRVDIPLGGGAAQAAAPPQDAPPWNDAPLDLFRDERVDIDLGPDRPTSAPGKAERGPVDIGPGGTFGQAGLADAAAGGRAKAAPPPAVQDPNPVRPFDPTSPQPLGNEDALLLFGDHDPYRHLGGADSRLPGANGLDVEYVAPRAGQELDLFGNPVGPAPQQAAKAPPFDLFADAQNDGSNATSAVPAPADANIAPLPPVVAGAMQAAQAAFDNDFEAEMQQLQAEGAAIAAEAPQPAAQATAPVPQAADAAPSADPDVDAMIARAAANEAKEEMKGADTRGDNELQPYQYPPATLFAPQPPETTAGAREEMKRTADLLVGTLSSFGVQTRILDVSRGPSVTRYEIQPQAGVKISRITGLADDIALNLAAAGVRIEAPIPGKPAVGIEVPNKVKTTVAIRGILESDTFTSASSPLAFALGKDIAGDVVVGDLTKMPHLLIAGSTGSGKSVCINAIIMSFLYKSSPEDVRMVLIDPKVVELAEYNGIPHLLIPVVTEPRQAAKALGQMVAEMEKRYHLFAEHGVRDIRSFNKLALRDGTLEKLPHIAIVIDELADLMMVAGKDVENFICRIAQKARAAGMHLIVATQRPSVDVITGLIKANIPSRIAFAVSSQVDSRTILDGAGAEKLLGMGDMLFMPIGANKPVRVQGTFVKDKEISAVLRFVKQNTAAQYDESVLADMEKVALSGAAGAGGRDDDDGDDVALLADPTFISAVETALEGGQISTSFLQRRLRLGYARAGRIMDEMERLGIVSQPEGSKPRQVLITRQQWQEMVMNADGQ
ncbi:MAG: DNA translocase FtsK [Ruminococcaceae bacterium]|nr:DNA translocase FtsK [Oscillospiraceae bacterium]